MRSSSSRSSKRLRARAHLPSSFSINVSLGSAILRLLREQPHQPGTLATLLDAPRLQVQEAVARLKEAGIDIALHPHRGYLLQSLPEKLVADDLLSRPGASWLEEIWTLESTGSTNTVALEQGQLGLPGPLAIFAEHQTAGRGRFARKWESDAGEGLSLSLLLRPAADQRFWPRLTTLAALAVARCVAELLPGKSVQIKWPNDVVASGKKIAGILAETGSDPARGSFVVLGIGLNVNQAGFPVPLDCLRGTRWSGLRWRHVFWGISASSYPAWNRISPTPSLRWCAEAACWAGGSHCTPAPWPSRAPQRRSIPRASSCSAWMTAHSGAFPPEKSR